MISGYNNFPGDVQEIFSDVIQQYHFKTVMAESDAVLMENDKAKMAFSINDDALTMSIKGGEQFYHVSEVAEMIDKDFYLKWNGERKEALHGLSRESYYKTYLSYYHVLIRKYFLHSLATGIIPLQKEYNQQRNKQDAYEKQYSIAWQQLQKLPYEHPIRQKYIHDDPSWVEDMMKWMEQGG